MARLNQERETHLQPIRMKTCQQKLEELGFDVTVVNHTLLTFIFNGKKVMFYPYSGWHSGSTIKDGRGFKNLIRQIEERGQ